jgi:sugar phosphate isomerase/epimerase
MKTRVHVSTSFAPHQSSVCDVVAGLAERGVSGAELGAVHRHEDDLEAKLSRWGMSFLVHNYFPVPSTPFVSNLASLSSDLRRRSLEHARESIDFCRRIGGHLYTFHPGFLTDPIGASSSRDNYDFVYRPVRHEETRSRYERCFQLFMDAVAELAEHAARLGVRIAVETQGSLANSDQLLMQHPDEFERFLEVFPPGTVGINLNVGHLNLAARRFAFDPVAFAMHIAGSVAAFELSHNEGLKDDHAPLVEGGWYWPLIRSPRFADAFKIFEGRYLSYQEAVRMSQWLERETELDGTSNEATP